MHWLQRRLDAIKFRVFFRQRRRNSTKAKEFSNDNRCLKKLGSLTAAPFAENCRPRPSRLSGVSSGFYVPDLIWSQTSKLCHQLSLSRTQNAAAEFPCCCKKRRFTMERGLTAGVFSRINLPSQKSRAWWNLHWTTKCRRRRRSRLLLPHKGGHISPAPDKLLQTAETQTKNGLNGGCQTFLAQIKHFAGLIKAQKPKLWWPLRLASCLELSPVLKVFRSLSNTLSAVPPPPSSGHFIGTHLIYTSTTTVIRGRGSNNVPLSLCLTFGVDCC